METNDAPGLRRYTVDQLAHDIGQTVCPALAPIIKNVLGDEIATWADRWDASHKRQMTALRGEFAQRLSELEARHRENLAKLQRSHEEHIAALTRMGVPAVDMAAMPVAVPHTGQVPAVVHDVPGPLFRIRWQQGQPAGEGEPCSVPEGWVLDDDQSGTWLDRINTRHCTGL